MTTSVRDNLIRLMKDEIVSFLSVVREDHDVEPFTEDDIQLWIINNLPRIEKQVDCMIREYTDAGEAHELNDTEQDWIREYIYPILIDDVAVFDPDFVLNPQVETA